MHGLVNLADYPIDQTGNKLSTVIDQVRNNLESDGCAVLPNFLTKKGIAELIRETNKIAHLAHHSSALTNAYFTEDDPNLDKSHPKDSFLNHLTLLSRQITF